ncbi:hypothetical protein ACH427_13390 [Streptomyces sp. NPDC020379]|uniref:hypothetical protein n=1 Tax=Streptomyces sp. NPDC020379 TaxID=3365071 RepID=UPI0037A70069
MYALRAGGVAVAVNDPVAELSCGMISTPAQRVRRRPGPVGHVRTGAAGPRGQAANLPGVK